MADARAQRIAANEGRFRDINERLRGDLQTVAGDSEPLRFVCECGNASCREGVPLSLEEYQGVRADPMHFAVAPGHEIADVESIIARHDHYFVVEKPEDVADIVG